MSDGEFLLETFTLPEPDDHPATIAGRLLNLPEFQHLKDGEAVIDWLLRSEEKTRHGRFVLGTTYIPSVQGDLSDCFDWMLARLLGRTPDFLIILDRTFWRSAPARDKEILVFHELLHCDQKRDAYGERKFHRDGTPWWAIRGHDIEEFVETVQRYGAWTDEIRRFVDATNGYDLANPG